MTLLPTWTRNYLLQTLAGSPDVFQYLVANIAPTDPIWDRRVEADRFTLREIFAHLADFEPVWTERISRIATEDPFDIGNLDEGQMAIDHDYAHSGPIKSLATYTEYRKVFVAYLQDLTPEAWLRFGFKGGDEWSIQAWAIQVSTHDMYHVQQVAEWLKRGRDAA